MRSGLLVRTGDEGGVTKDVSQVGLVSCLLQGDPPLLPDAVVVSLPRLVSRSSPLPAASSPPPGDMPSAALDGSFRSKSLILRPLWVWGGGG